MEREILTHPLTTQQIEAELDHFVEYFSSRGCLECEALFGPAWGIDYYSEGESWESVRLPLTCLAAEARRAGTLGWGGLGMNDLYLTVPGAAPTFRFCNDSDVHVSFKEPDDVTEHFYERWKALGFHPAEWRKSDSGAPNDLLRSD
jgi:hypothetical protein